MAPRPGPSSQHARVGPASCKAALDSGQVTGGTDGVLLRSVRTQLGYSVELAVVSRRIYSMPQVRIPMNNVCC
jgi:hypothetical protein